MQRDTATCYEQEFDTLGNPPEKQNLNWILWLEGSQVCPCAVIGMRDVHQNLEGLPELHRPHPTLRLLHHCHGGRASWTLGTLEKNHPLGFPALHGESP